MEVISEEYPQQRLLHSKDVPGLFVCGTADAGLCLALQAETLRFQRCFPDLPLAKAVTYSIVERLQHPIQLPPGDSVGLFAADMDRTPAQLETACALLTASVGFLEDCYDSFPQPDRDYYQGEGHRPWEPASGRAALDAFAGRLRACLAVYGVDYRPDARPSENLQRGLALLGAQPDFAHDRLLYTGESYWCAGRWLRYLTEQCHLWGRRMYQLGVAQFGRKQIRDPFCFEDPFAAYGLSL